MQRDNADQYWKRKRKTCHSYILQALSSRPKGLKGLDANGARDRTRPGSLKVQEMLGSKCKTLGDLDYG